MPRTKQRKLKVDEKVVQDNINLLVKDFERQAHLRILKMEADAKMAIKSLGTMMNVTIARLPKEIREMTLGEILQYENDDQKENYETSSSVEDISSKTSSKQSKTTKRITAASDDGYVTEGVRSSRISKAKKDDELTSRPRTRSSSRTRKIKLSEVNQDTAKKIKTVKRSIRESKFKTPAQNNYKIQNNEFSLVTPKVKPNTPLNVLRRPRQGEMVLSMQGSPLLVSAVVRENIANINVPLSNGNVMSLLPEDGLRMSHIPALDPETMRQLETLKNHIEKVISAK